MKLRCRLAVVDCQGDVIVDFSKGSVAVGNMNKKSTPSKKSFIIVRTLSKNTGTRFNLIGNIEGLFTKFLNKGQVTVSLKEPSCYIFITKADPKKLKSFIVYYRKLLLKDSPLPVPMAASEPPVCRINLNLRCQEKYKSRMENIIAMNFNLDHFTGLKIRYCTLNLAGDQVPIAGAIRKMKNLTTLKLEGIELHSSTFLEIESKELKQLHLRWSKIRVPIAPLFKNGLCYKDSLVELQLDGNHWSHVPNGIFQFGNLLKLSLSDNRITHLPDMFTNLPKLQELDLSYNRLRRVPSSIFKIENLLQLSLDFNDITKLPNVSTNSSKLQQLSLCFNQLRRLPPSIFECRNLSELALDNNRITELPDMFTNLSQLQKLILTDNQLTHLPPSIFQIQNLCELLLSNNFITELPDVCMNLPELNTLELGDNRLRSVPSGIFALQNLSELFLRNNHITELPDVINLPKLAILWLCNNELSSVPPTICELQNLSELYLSGNSITELPDKFANLSKLKLLSLTRNKLKYLPPSIFALHLKQLDINYNEFNFEIPPSVDSEMNLHSLKELSYRAILNHKLTVKEGILPEKFLKDLENYQQCICGCKFVEGQELLFFCNLKDILSFTCDNRDLRVPIRGKMCTSLESCFLDRFTNCGPNH